MTTDKLGRLVLAFGPQALVSMIGDACNELADFAERNGRHDIAVRLRHDARVAYTAGSDCKTWDCSAIADCPIGLKDFANQT